MKRILLTTTALTMTAGIAAAEVSVTGDLTLGFNDTGTSWYSCSSRKHRNRSSYRPLVTTAANRHLPTMFPAQLATITTAYTTMLV